MNWFSSCQTITEAKKEYYKLCKMYHPDISTDPNATKKMQEVNLEFENFKVGDNSKLKYKEEQQHFDEEAKQFIKIVTDLFYIKSIEFEVLGSWVWVTKSVKEKKEEIKAINPKGQKYDLYKPFIWNRKKGMWYCSPKSYKGGSSGKSHDYIRSKYGATTYQGKKDNAEVIAR